jgi:cell division protein ZapE
VTDIADAMILGRLFQQLFAGNVVMVATSNTAPRDLYRDGLNRQLFTPFIKLIEERMETHELESTKDYRLEKLQGSDLYLTPADARAGAAMNASFRKLTGETRRAADAPPQGPQHHRAGGGPWRGALHLRRSLRGAAWAPRLSAHRARFSYADDRGDPGARIRAAQRSFITLIDVLYDNGVGLIASAAAEPQAIYVDGVGASFARTASRLMEMRSDAYLAERHRRGGHAAEPG